MTGDARQSLVQTLAGPAIPSCPERANRTRRTLVVDAFFVWAADNPVGHDDRFGSGLGDERQRFFRDPDVLANVPSGPSTASAEGRLPRRPRLVQWPL